MQCEANRLARRLLEHDRFVRRLNSQQMTLNFLLRASVMPKCTLKGIVS